VNRFSDRYRSRIHPFILGHLYPDGRDRMIQRRPILQQLHTRRVVVPRLVWYTIFQHFLE
jgi:hypothetical protein